MAEQVVVGHRDESRAKWAEFCSERSGERFIQFLDTLSGRDYANEQPMLFPDHVVKEIETLIREGELKASAPTIREAAIGAISKINLLGEGLMNHGQQDGIYMASILQRIIRAASPEISAPLQVTTVLDVTFSGPGRESAPNVGG